MMPYFEILSRSAQRGNTADGVGAGVTASPAATSGSATAELTMRRAHRYFEAMNEVSFWRRQLPYRYYNATIALIVINVAFFLFRLIVPRSVIYLALIPSLVIRESAVWQIVTYMFVHGSIGHILFNMLALLFFGLPLERRLGSSEFLVLYFVAGVGAGLATLAVNWYTGLGNVAVAGASGAVFGVLLAFATLFPDTRILLFWVLPVRAPIAVLVFTLLELFFLLRGTNTGVAHLTHLAGLVFAYLYLVIRTGINPLRVFFRRF
jgi:membrane associated rhomboid family serine protease